MVDEDLGNAQSTSSALEVKETLNPSLLHALPYFSSLLAFPCLVVAALFGEWFLVAPFVYLLLVVLADDIFGLDVHNLDPLGSSQSSLFMYSVALWFWAIGWLGTLGFVLYQIFLVGTLVWWEAVVLAFALFFVGQACFTVGHELIHRRSLWERRLGDFILTSLSYPYYATEHLYKHHTTVGTPSDSGSAPRGLSFWRYLPRELADGFTSVWHVIRNLLARRRRSFWHYSNPYWRYLILLVLVYGSVFWLGGIWAVLIYAGFCLCAIIAMKLLNYIQHYGLRRVYTANGTFERVQTGHTWSAAYRATNKLAFNLQRHADHHVVDTRHFALLQHTDENASPQLPKSFAKMSVLALFPGSWFKHMNPLVDAWRKARYPEVADWRVYDSPVTIERPSAFSEIQEIFEKSPLLAKWIHDSPDFLDCLERKEFTELDLPKGFGPDPEFETIAKRGLALLYWVHEFGLDEMKVELGDVPVQDTAEAVDATREWVNNKVVQVCLHVMRESLAVSDAQIALTNVAEAAIYNILQHIERDVGRSQYGSATLFALGDLARGESSPEMDLQLLYLYDDDSDFTCKKIGRRLMRAMDRLTVDCLLFQTHKEKSDDSKVQSLTDFEKTYLALESTTDFAHLMAIRNIEHIGQAHFVGRTKVVINEVLRNGFARHALLRQLAEVQEISEAADPTSRTTLVNGYLNVENAIRRLQLNHVDRFIDLAKRNSVAVAEVVQNQALCPAEEAAELLQGAKFWRNLAGIQRFLLDNTMDLNDADLRARDIVARACGEDDWEGLQVTLRAKLLA